MGSTTPALTPEYQPAVCAAKANTRINLLEQALARSGFDSVEMPVTNRFTPGLYMREIFMPAGTMLTSKIHKTCHPFVVLEGKVSVWNGDGDEEYIEGPFVGITQPGTRRVLYIHEDTRWITFHPSDETDLEKLEDQLIEPHDFPRLEGKPQTEKLEAPV